MLDAGYIYFMFSPRSLLFKIGKGKNFERRKRQIDESVPGSLVCLFKVWLINKSKYEKELHRIYEKRRVVWTGSGKTEYFKLNPVQVAIIIARMAFYQIGQVLAFFCLIIFILYLFNIAF